MSAKPSTRDRWSVRDINLLGVAGFVTVTGMIIAWNTQRITDNRATIKEMKAEVESWTSEHRREWLAEFQKRNPTLDVPTIEEIRP